MAHHKRHRPKQQRAGCLLCKPHKANCAKDSADAVLPRDRRRMDGPRAIAEAVDAERDDRLEAAAMPGPDCPCEGCRLEFADRAA